MYKWLDISAKTPEEAKVAILGVPFDGGTSQEAGATEAPAKIREFGEVYMPCATDDWHLLDTQPLVYDFGDVELNGGANTNNSAITNAEWEEYFNRVEEEALKVMKYGKFNLFIGGDHSVTIPLHRAFKRAHGQTPRDDRVAYDGQVSASDQVPGGNQASGQVTADMQTPANGQASGRTSGTKLGIIHFDAHFDLCDCYDEHIWSHANTEKRALDDIISPEDLLFLGIRAAEPEEVEIINREKAITVLSASDVDEMGWKECAKVIYDKFKDYDHIYFTLDIDVLDPAFAPGTGTPVSGGITSRELINLVRFMLNKLPINDMDIVEVAPPLDSNDITSWAAMRVIEEVFSIIDKLHTNFEL